MNIISLKRTPLLDGHFHVPPAACDRYYSMFSLMSVDIKYVTLLCKTGQKLRNEVRVLMFTQI